MDPQNQGSKRSASPEANKLAAKSQKATEQLKDAVVGQMNEARDRAQSTKQHTTDRIRGVASQLRNMSDTLREEDPLLADVAQRASRGVEGVARYVNDASPQSLIRDTEQLARRQPALFYGAAFLLGLAAGRFIKSTQPEGSYTSYRRHDDRGDRGDGQTDEGARLSRRDDRGSGFFPAADRSARSNQRFQDSYDATFGTTRETTTSGALEREVRPSTRSSAPRTSTSEAESGAAIRKGEIS